MEFSYTFDFHGNTLVYAYKKMTWQKTTEEHLSINGTHKLTFLRAENKFLQTFAGASSLGNTITNENLAAVKYVRANASLDLQDNDNKVFLEFCRFVDSMLLFWSLQNRMYTGYETGTANLMEAVCQGKHLEQYNAFLKEIGIDRRIVSKVSPDGTVVPYYDFGEKRLLPFSPETMSNGESSMLLFFYWLMEMENKGAPSLLIVDEFDAFYHIRLSRQIVAKLAEKAKGQVILTTHNDSLISNDILRPDAYFILKDNQISSFDKNTPKEIKEAHNLRRMFDAGSFEPESKGRIH